MLIITVFPLIKKKSKTDKTRYYGTNDVEIIAPLKHLGHFWRTLEIPLIKCEINLILTWSTKCVLSNSGNQERTFAVKDN